MRRIVLWASSTVAALVLLFSYGTSRGTTPPAIVARSVASSESSSSGSSGSIGSASPPGPASPTSPTSRATPAPGTTRTTPTTRTTTSTGSVAQTRWGPVQVSVTVTGGRITDVTVLQQPSGNNHDVEINSYALPVLHDEAVTKQSARIDTVSGATVTSDGYIESLQSAIDAAHLGS